MSMIVLRLRKNLTLICVSFMSVMLINVSLVTAEPTINEVSIRGLQIGGTTTITLKGSDLAPNPRVFAPFAISRQGVHEGANSESFTIDITLPASVSPDLYPIRVVTDRGISNVVMVGVDSLPQVMLMEHAASLPVAMHGNLTGDQRSIVTFDAKKDQQIVVDIEGQRLGGNLRPVIRISSDDGRQLARGQRSRSIHGDARAVLRIPNDGRYRIELHDQVYKGPAPGFYRLKIGELQYADFAYPMSLGSNRDLQIQFVSSNIEEQPWIHPTNATDQGVNWVRAGWPTAGRFFTGAQPLLFVSSTDVPTFVESKNVACLNLPAMVHGRLQEPDETDEYVVAVTPGKKLRLDLHSHRLGTPLDSVLTILDERGKELAKNDDHDQSLDPGLDFSVPETVEKIQVRVSSLAGHSGADCIYRLIIRETDNQSFSVRAPADHLIVASGGRTIIPLEIDRQGYNGELDIELDSKRAMLLANSPTVPAGADKCLLSITAPSYTQAVLPIGILARRKDDVTISNLAQVPAIRGIRDNSPRLNEIVASIVSQQPPTRVDWAKELPKELVRGGRHPAKVAFANKTKSKVRLSLMTSQRMPKKEENKKQVDDLDRAIHLQDRTPMIESDQSDAMLELVVPNDLAQRNWSLAVKAEFLTDDGKTVTHVAYTEPVAVPAVLGLGLELTSESKRTLTIGEGDAVAFYGKIARHKDLSYPVNITLNGLPKELGVPQVVMPADQSVFALSVPVGQIKDAKKLANLNLSATFAGKVDDKHRDVRSNNIGLEIELRKKDK